MKKPSCLYLLETQKLALRQGSGNKKRCEEEGKRRREIPNSPGCEPKLMLNAPNTSF